MQFGLFYEASENPGQTHAERFAEMLDLIAYGETLGFDVAWLAEIHFGGAFSLLSAPLTVVPAIAARTQRIRIGTAVSLLPLHHPLSLAEQAATADLLSGDPHECIDRLQAARDEFGLCQVICWFDQGCRLPMAEVKRAMAQCADEVMPKV